MEKRKPRNVPVLLVSSIPWAFLAMYGDKTLHTSSFYALLLLAALVLGLLSRRFGCIPFAAAGNLLSCLISLLCAHCLTDWESWHFKPFGITGLVIALSLFPFMLQFLIWNFRKDRAPHVSLLYAVCAVTLVLAAVAILLLSFSALRIGAI